MAILLCQPQWAAAPKVQAFRADRYPHTLVLYIKKTERPADQQHPAALPGLRRHRNATDELRSLPLLPQLRPVRLHYKGKPRVGSAPHFRLELIDRKSFVHRMLHVSRLEPGSSVLAAQPFCATNRTATGHWQILSPSTRCDQEAGSTELYASQDQSTVLLVSTGIKRLSIYGIIDGQMMIMPENGHDHQMLLGADLLGPSIRSLLANTPPGPSTGALAVQPQITVVLDHLAADNQTESHIWRYSVLFLHLLDRAFFRSLASPEIRLKLQQILVLRQPLDFQRQPPVWLGNDEQQQPENSRRQRVNALAALDGFGAWAYRHRASIGPTDLFLVLTGQDLCLATSQPDRGICSYDTVQGQSVVGGACRQIDVRLERSMNVAVIEHGLGARLPVAAHELAHLLGVLHDGEWPLDGILGPGARSCADPRHQRSWLMNAEQRQVRLDSAAVPPHWSHCSLEQLQHFVGLPRAACLRQVD